MKSLKESILSSTKSGKFITPVKWSKEFKKWNEAENAFLDFYNIKDTKAKAHINSIFDTYDNNFGFPSSFIFDLDFEEKAKYHGIDLKQIEFCKSIFTDNRYIIVYNDGVYYIWDETDDDFRDIAGKKFLDFIKKN
jgi:hypothetical protein